MKFMTVKSYPYSAQLFGFTASTDSGGNITRTYSYSRDVSFTGGISAGSSLTVYTESPLMELQQLRVLKDSLGNEIFPGIWYEVRNTQPVMNAYGIVEGYRASVARLA